MTKNKKALFSRGSDDWGTPDYIIRYLESIYGKMFDPCPLENDIEKFDGLEMPWCMMNFVNPPYSEAEKWIIKGLEEREKGNESIFLVPARTDTKLWHNEIFPEATEILFLKGRIKFVGGSTSAPFPSAFIFFGNGEKKSWKTIEIVKPKGGRYERED